MNSDKCKSTILYIYMYMFNSNNNLVFLFYILGVCKSVKKCMYGRFNKETCACDCEKGFFGDNCRC